MALPTIAAQDTPQVLAGQIMETEQQRSANFARDLYTAPLNVPLAFVDTTVTSLANITDWTGLTDFSLSDGIMPDSFTTYQRNREAWQATSDVVSLFMIAGAATKAIRAGGAIEAGMGAAGVPASVAARVVSQRGRIAQIETELSSVLQNTAIANGRQGLAIPALTDVAVPWNSLNGAVHSADEVRAIASSARLGANIRETVASEVAIAGLMNDSDLLFPEDMGLGSYLAMAAFGGAVVSSIEGAIARAGYRRSLAQAQAIGSRFAAAERASGRAVAEIPTSVILGERWTTAGDAARRMNAADNLADSAGAAGLAGASAEAMRAGAQRVSQEAKNDLTAVTRQLFGDATIPKVAKAQDGRQLSEARLGLVEGWARAEPNNMLGVQSLEDAAVIARMEHETELAHEAVIKAAQSGDAAQEAAAQARVQQLDSVSAGVIEADGTTNIARVRQTPWQEQVPAGKTTLRANQREGLYWLQDKGAPSLGISENGIILRRTGRSHTFVGEMGALDFTEITSLYKLLARGAADSSEKGFAAAFSNTFSGDLSALSYPVLDAVNTGKLAQNFGLNNQANLVALQGMRQTGEVSKAAFFAKYEAYAQVMGKGGESAHDLSKRLNMTLHEPTGENSALLDAMEMLRQSNPKSVRDAFADSSFDEVMSALAGLHSGQAGRAVVNDLAKRMKVAALDNGMLSLHDAPTPVGFLRKVLDGASDTDANFAKIAEASRQARFAKLGQLNNSFTQGVQKVMSEMPNVVEKASDVGGIARDGLIESRGILAGAARAVTTTTNRFRDSLPHQMAHTLGQAIKRALDPVADAAVRPFAEVHNQLLRDKNYGVLAQHSDYTSIFRVGAELEEPYLHAGFNKLNKESPRVQRMMRSVFGRDIAELVGDGDLYVFDKAAAYRGEYKPLKFTVEGADAINIGIAASYKLLENQNEIARLMGRAETRQVFGHLPPADFSTLQMRMIADKTGRVVGHVTGKTAQDATRLQQQAIRRAQEVHGEQLIPASDQQTAAWLETQNQTRFSQLTDYSDPLLQTGMTKSRNLDLTRDVSGDVMQSQLISLRNGYDRLRGDATYAVFEPVILKNRQMERVGSAGALGQAQGAGKRKAFFNGAEEWENLLMARSGRPAGSVAANYENTTVAWLDDVINAAAEKFAPDLARPNPLRFRGAAKQKAAIDKIVADYDPMGAAAEAVARLKVLPAADARRLASTLQAANHVTGEVFLKFANIAHPILNMMSVAVTTPAVASQLVRRSGETLDAWKRRAGPWAEFLDENSVATVSSTKLMTNGLQFFHSAEGQRVLTEAQGHGMITANMLEELNKTIFSTPTKASQTVDWMRRYLDVINAPVNAALKAAGKSPSADTLSERSETYVRALLHATGYQFAKTHGRVGMSEMEIQSFAHYFANQNIADYAPNIRGQAFRGVAGIPLGLFQSFGINFLQRAFRYVENKDARSAMVQAATQTAVFGAEGLPGWPAVNEFFGAANDKGGSANSTFNDRLYRAYGKELTDVMLTGTISNLPRLFGEDGVNLYTSGDTNPRVFNFTPPAFALASQSIEMVREGMKAAIEDTRRVAGGGEFDSNRVAEVLASYMPNRGVRSMLELALGYSADRAGDLIQKDTRSGVALLARLLGTRTVDETRQRNALYANSLDLQNRRARLAQVGRAFSAAVRAQASELGVDPDGVNIPQEMLDSYISRWMAQGGRIDTARTAFNRLVDKAVTPETLRTMRNYVSKDGKLKGGDIYQFAVERLLQGGYSGEDLPSQ